jgi:hypothetical protein
MYVYVIQIKQSQYVYISWVDQTINEYKSLVEI